MCNSRVSTFPSHFRSPREEEEINFTREGFGRRSMSEKRRAHLDPRSSEFYQKLKQSKDKDHCYSGLQRIHSLSHHRHPCSLCQTQEDLRCCYVTDNGLLNPWKWLPWFFCTVPMLSAFALVVTATHWQPVIAHVPVNGNFVLTLGIRGHSL